MSQDNLFYSPGEERINIITHAVGIAAAAVALLLLMNHSADTPSTTAGISFTVYGITLMLMYCASTFYHSAVDTKKRKVLKIVDHSAIYLLIAGTYTPYALITLHGETGRVLLIVVWSIAAAGILMKLFFTGKFRHISTALYLVMGWLILSVVKQLYANLPLPGFIWLFAGGAAYSAGAVIYSIKKIKNNHAIFHFFVLAGSLCHFISIYFYV